MTVAACGDDSVAGHDAALNPDGQISDAGSDGSADARVVPNVDAGLPTTLSHEDLYSNFATKTVAADLIEYAPDHALWSDGAIKRRWIHLPAGTKIDTSDMDHWKFPIGTRFFKEFGFNGKRVETRMIAKFGDSEYLMGSFVWRADGSDADWMPGGMVTTVDPGTGVSQTYAVPSDTQCVTCHRGEPGKILGFSAIQLSHAAVGTQPTLKSLAAAGTLTNPPPAGTDYPVPGDATTAAALGALHANCGHCHNPNQTIFASIDQWLQLRTADRTPQTTTIWMSTVGKELAQWHMQPGHMRIKPMDPDNSGIVERMTARGSQDQMPPRPFSYVVDTTDLNAIKTWIGTLTP